MKSAIVSLVVGVFVVAAYLALWMMGGKISTPVAQIINWIILATVAAVSVYFVGRDTRRRVLSWPETIAWVIVSVATFPIGFGIYFLLRKRTSRKSETQR